MRIRGLYAGLPGAASFNPLLPDNDPGASGGTNGGAGAPPAPVAPPAPAPPAAPPAPPVAGALAAAGPNGFPENTPVAEMTDAQRASYYAHYNRRDRAELERVQAELAAAKPLADQFAALEAASKSEAEKAIEAARKDGEKAGREAAEAAARTTYGTQLVQARLDAALTAKGLTAEQMTALAGDGSRFIGATGVDAAALDAFLAALPDKPTGPAGPPDLGGGRRTPVTAGGLQAGADLYASRHPKRTTT
jgi:hypothetical protein